MEIFIGVMIAALAVLLYIFLGPAKTDAADTEKDCGTCRSLFQRSEEEPCCDCKDGSKWKESKQDYQDLD